MKASEATDVNRLYEITVIPENNSWEPEVVGTIVQPTHKHLWGEPYFRAIRWSPASVYTPIDDEMLFFGDVTLRPLTLKEMKKIATPTTD